LAGLSQLLNLNLLLKWSANRPSAGRLAATTYAIDPSRATSSATSLITLQMVTIPASVLLAILLSTSLLKLKANLIDELVGGLLSTKQPVNKLGQSTNLY